MILIPFTITDPIGAFTMDGTRTLRIGYYMTDTGNGTVAYQITKNSTDKKLTITHNADNTFLNGMSASGFSITWYATAMYLNEA